MTDIIMIISQNLPVRAKVSTDVLNSGRESFFLPINGKPSLICHLHSTFEPVREKETNEPHLVISLLGDCSLKQTKIVLIRVKIEGLCQPLLFSSWLEAKSTMVSEEVALKTHWTHKLISWCWRMDIPLNSLVEFRELS